MAEEKKANVELTKEEMKAQRDAAKAKAAEEKAKAQAEREEAKKAAAEERAKLKAERDAEKAKLAEERAAAKEAKAAERAAAAEEKARLKAEREAERAAKKEQKAKEAAEAKANKKPGVIASILKIISDAETPITQDQILEQLVAIFPEREPAGLKKTIMAQTGGSIRPNRMEMEKGVTFIIDVVEGTKVKTYLLDKTAK